MKRLILLLLALVMAASFAACGSGGNANDNPSSFKTSDGYEIKADVLYVVFDPVSTLDRRDEIIKAHLREIDSLQRQHKEELDELRDTYQKQMNEGIAKARKEAQAPDIGELWRALDTALDNAIEAIEDFFDDYDNHPKIKSYANALKKTVRDLNTTVNDVLAGEK